MLSSDCTGLATADYLLPTTHNWGLSNMTITHYLAGNRKELVELSKVLFALGRPDALKNSDTNTTKFLFPICRLKDNPKGYNYALAMDKDVRRQMKSSIKDNVKVLRLLTDHYAEDEKQLMRDRINEERDISVGALLPQSLKDRQFTAAQAEPYLEEEGAEAFTKADEYNEDDVANEVSRAPRSESAKNTEPA